MLNTIRSLYRRLRCAVSVTRPDMVSATDQSTNMKDEETSWLDWETDAARYSCTITAGDLPVGSQLTICRDPEFGLQADVRVPSLSLDDLKAIPHVVNCRGRSTDGAEVLVSNAFVRRRSADKDGAATVTLEPQEVSVSHRATQPAILIEWLANFGSELMFPRDTATTKSTSLSRVRATDEWSSRIDIREHKNFTSDHLLLTCTLNNIEVGFLLGKAVDRSKAAIRPGFIEYRDRGVGLPTEEQRELIRAGLSFIFDHQLVLLGETRFTSSHSFSSGRAVAAKYLGSRHLLRNPAEAPAPIYDNDRSHILSESRVCELLSRFIEHNATFRLDRVVNKIWDAKTSPLDSRIARLVAIIELLRDTRLGDGPTLLPKKDWAAICVALKATLAATAKGMGITDERALTHLENKLPNINFSSSTKQFDRFFADLHLTISKVEQKAMDRRNEQAHGTIYERAHYGELRDSVRTVQVLLNRVVLALIGHHDVYNDHTCFPCEEKALEEPSGTVGA